MGNCNSLNCTAPAYDEPLDADGDIVGLGVLVAFFSTALATIIAILWGYFNDALPEEYLSESDNYIISMYHESKFSRKVLPWFQQKWEAAKRPISKIFLDEQAAVAHYSLSRVKRTEALAKFILSLSDQQLVTGLAILIGALGNRCKVSLYEFRVVVSLAWFSSTTHLATLAVLESYFIENKIVRNWRVAGMLSLMVLLIFSLLTQIAGIPQTVPLQCGLRYLFTQDYEGPEFNISTVSRNSTTSPWNNAAVDNYYNSFGRPVRFITALLLCVIVISTYYSRVTVLYHGKAAAASSAERFAQMLVCFRMKQLHKEFSAAVSTKEFKASWQQSKKEYKNQQYELVMSGEERKIPQLGFGMAFGIFLVVISRDYDPPPLGPSSYSIDFGQIVPIFLLSLPMLAAAEIYYDSRGVASENESSSSSSGASSISNKKETKLPTLNEEGRNSPETQHISTPNTDSEEAQPAVPLAIGAEILDPSSDKRIVKAVFWIFVYHLLTLLASAGLYAFLADVSGPILYISIMTSTSLITLYQYLSSVKALVMYASIQKQRGRGLQEGVRLSMDPQNCGPGSHTDDLSLSTNNEAGTGANSSAGQDRDVSAGHSNDSEYIPLQNLAPGVDQMDLTNIPTKPLSKTSTRSINSSTYPPPVQAQTPTRPPISPTDDGRLYYIPPHRHDTEAHLGILPVESPSAHSSGPSISGELYPEPEELTRGVATGVNASSETTVGEGGVRRRATVEIPGKVDDACERI